MSSIVTSTYDYLIPNKHLDVLLAFTLVPTGIAITPLEVIRQMSLMENNGRHPASIGGSLRFLTNRGLLERITEYDRYPAYVLTEFGLEHLDLDCG